MFQLPKLVYVDGELEPLMSGFLTNRKSDCLKIKQYLANDDLEGILSVGHIISGVSGSYGFTGLSKLAEILEAKAKLGEKVQIKVIVEEIEDYLNEVLVVFKY